MVNPTLVESRLIAQGLVTPTAADPHQVLAMMGPMQGQELSGLLSSIALRVGTSDRVSGGGTGPGRSAGTTAQVTDAFDRGEIVRGYPMRSTVFALAAEDARWVTELCSAQQRRESTRRLQRDGLTTSDIERAHTLLAGYPEGLSRKEIGEMWSANGFPDEKSLRYLLIRDMMLHGTAVYGPFRDGHQLIVASDDWLPEDSTLDARFNGDRTAATAALLTRYLTSHGPADLRDFAWWTKLPVALIKDAAGEVTDDFEETHGRLHRPGLFDDLRERKRKAHGTFLLPAFDEIVLGYRDRLSFMKNEHHEQVAPGNRGVFRRTVVRGGKFIATWSAASYRLNPSPFRPLSAAAQTDINRAFRRFPQGR